MKYDVLEGNGGYGESDLGNLIKKVNHVLSEGGETVGGIFFKHFPMQAVLLPEGYNSNNSNNSKNGGKLTRKTRKQRR
jgi:hypothetical protein